MALKKVAATTLAFNEGKELAFESITTAGAALEFDGSDHKTLIIAKGAGTLTINKGNGIQGVVDATVTVTEQAGVVLESGFFKQVTGEDAGRVTVKPSAAMEIAVVKLP